MIEMTGKIPKTLLKLLSRRPVVTRAWSIRASLLAVLLSGCGGGERTIVDPPLPPPVTKGLTLVPHADDAAVAQLLGWSGRIPGAEVTITAPNGTAPLHTLTSSNTGVVALPELDQGKYLVSVKRVLSSQEMASLGAGSDVLGFAAFDTLLVTSATTGAPNFAVPAARRGSLVISEVSFTSKMVNNSTYAEAAFIEVYNNSDTTIHLDGIMLGVGFEWAYNLSNYPCSVFESFTLDPASLWSLYHQAFPGGGRDYPLAPGAVAVVAVDAIDHSSFSPGLLDLRGANFEFTWPGDVDNPSVPNMIDVGVEASNFGDGHMHSPGGIVSFLATAGSLDGLPRQKDPRSSRLWRSIPANRIMDVFTTGNTYAPPEGWQRCPRLVHENFDRRTGIFIVEAADGYLFSASRRRFASTGGLPRLQDTRTSFADFTRGARTPGTIP